MNATPLDDERRALVEKYIPMASAAARRWVVCRGRLHGRRVGRLHLEDFEEFEAAAFEALVEAAATFKLNFGVNFATYARVLVRGALSDYHRWLLRIDSDVDRAIARPEPHRTHHRHRDLAERLVDSLPARERRLAELIHLRGYSQEDAAAELGISRAHASRVNAAALAFLVDAGHAA